MASIQRLTLIFGFVPALRLVHAFDLLLLLLLRSSLALALRALQQDRFKKNLILR
jgi:hypothetical protein